MPSPSRLSLAAALAALLAAGPAHALIDVPEGAHFLYLTTGPEDAHGGGTTGTDLNGDGFDEGDLSLVDLEFEAASDGTLSFYWDVLTGEVSGGVSDFFRVVLDGSEILSESILTPGDTPLPPPGLTGFSGGALYGPDGSYFQDGRLGWSMFSTAVMSGFHVLQIFVYDDDDLYVDTALLIDGLALDGTVFRGFEGDPIGGSPSDAGIQGNVSVEGAESFVPEPGTTTLLLVAGLAFALRSRR